MYLSLSRSTSPYHVLSLDYTSFQPSRETRLTPAATPSRVALIIIKNFHVSAALAYINILGDRVQLKESARLHLPIYLPSYLCTCTRGVGVINVLAGNTAGVLIALRKRDRHKTADRYFSAAFLHFSLVDDVTSVKRTQTFIIFKHIDYFNQLKNSLIPAKLYVIVYIHA